jgi:hypothetical protein
VTDIQGSVTSYSCAARPPFLWCSLLALVARNRQRPRRFRPARNNENSLGAARIRHQRRASQRESLLFRPYAALVQRTGRAICATSSSARIRKAGSC